MSDDERMSDDEQADDEELDTWPVKGPATGRQAIAAIGLVFFLGLVVGFLLSRAF